MHAIAAEAAAGLKKAQREPFATRPYPNIYRERSKAFRPALSPQQGLHHNCSDPSGL